MQIQITGSQKSLQNRQTEQILANWNYRFSEVVANSKISCLLYPFDAADEEDSVDLGGRRIIKKKISSTGVPLSLLTHSLHCLALSFSTTASTYYTS